MKLVGIAMVRNEADIVAVTLAHHLRAGCDAILVVDNGSSDGTDSVLSRFARRDPRLHWIRDAGPYRQAEIMTGLAREATRRGADWVLPFDADEFWWTDSEGGLRSVLVKAGEAGVLTAPVVNFVQRRRQRRSTARALRHMTMRAVPVPPAETARERVTAGEIAFVEIVYPPKVIVRASPTVELAPGNHAASGVDGPVLSTEEVTCLHAPLRSRHALAARADVGRRVAATFKPDDGWHARRWLRLAEEGRLDDEWAANSYWEGALSVYGHQHSLVPDGRLSVVVRELLPRLPRLIVPTHYRSVRSRAKRASYSQ